MIIQTNKLEKVQYKDCLEITGTFKGTSGESLYRVLGLECLQTRRWYRKTKILIRYFACIKEPALQYKKPIKAGTWLILYQN